MFDIFQVVSLPAAPIQVVDVGAMWLGEENVSYGPLLKRRGLCRVIGFEPVKAECDKLNAMGLRDQTYLPHFIGDGSKRKFYLNNYPMTSSLYEPWAEMCRLFQNLEELMRPVEVSDVQTRRLDDLPEIASMDMLKIDVQGAEVDCFRGADRLLKETVLIHTEINFVPMYKDQPLFADVDADLRRRGFMLHAFHGMMGRAYKPVVVKNDPNLPVRQAMWSDAVYVRDVMRLQELSAEQLLKLAVMLHMVYGSVDLASLVLHHYDLKVGTTFWSRYIEKLTGTKPDKGQAPPVAV